MAQSNPYFPCGLIEHEGSFSIICSSFHYFDDYFGPKEGGGYSVEKLAKKLVKEHEIRDVKFDSEAGMFCAYSDKKTPLKKLCVQLRKITGGEKKHLAQESTAPSIPLDEAERLLLKGFVLSLDKRAQKRFLKHVPCPALSKQQAENLNLIQNGTDAEKIKAAKRINSEARTYVRDWDHYLSHPDTTELLLKCCDANRDNPPVLQELIWALVFICDRHLPDARTEPYFRECLENKHQRMRILGISGLYNLCRLNAKTLKPLLDDKSANVRQQAEQRKQWIRSRAMVFPDWMFEPKTVRQCRSGSR